MSTTPPPSNSSRPIPIRNPGAHTRGRSASTSSDMSSNPGLSPSSQYSLPTPQLLSKPLTPSSPILSYFFGPKDSLNKPAVPGARTLPKLPPVVDDETETPTTGSTSPILGHHRSLSGSSPTWSRFPTSSTGTGLPAPLPSTEASSQRVLRRLSLSGAFSKPPVPQPPSSPSQFEGGGPLQRARTVVAANEVKGRPTGRRATLAAPEVSVKARAPSPMGERMLKGQFDGFN